MTTPSCAGISAAMRTSCDRPQAWVTEASLSTTTLRMPPSIATAPRAASPLARRFAVHAPRGRHERERRLHALDEHAAALQQQVHLARHPLLGAEQQRLDVATHRIEQLALVHQIAVGLCELLLDALLPAG